MVPAFGIDHLTCIVRGLAGLALLLCAVPAAADPGDKSPDVIPGSTREDAEGLIDLAEAIPDLLIIDSRIAGDRRQGYIEGSVSLPDEATDCDSLAATVPSKTAPLLFYCNGPKCGRSAVAVGIALTCGYANLYWFRGGFEEWKEKNYPYIKD